MLGLERLTLVSITVVLLGGAAVTFLISPPSLKSLPSLFELDKEMEQDETAVSHGDTLDDVLLSPFVISESAVASSIPNTLPKADVLELWVLLLY